MQKRKILITGANGALGSALAKYYAQPNTILILQTRQESTLDEIVKICLAQGASVEKVILDLINHAELREWLSSYDESSIPDLVIANAGVSINNTKNNGENWSEINNLIEVNIKSTFALVNAVIPHMRKRGSGQIVLISSLAAYFGLPVTPSYSASKAAIKAYGEALRGWLSREGIKVNVVMPGDFKSKMCDTSHAPQKFLMSPQTTAKKIAMGIKRNKARISFPFLLSIGAWLLAVLPPQLSQLMLQLLGYNTTPIKRD